MSNIILDGLLDFMRILSLGEFQLSDDRKVSHKTSSKYAILMLNCTESLRKTINNGVCHLMNLMNSPYPFIRVATVGAYGRLARCRQYLT
jgi:hypothetical protein